MKELPVASVDRIIRNAGADRVSEDAKEALAAILEEYGTKVSAEAIKLCKHAGRKTVKEEDIRLASQRIH
ncbi:histone family protein [Methanocella sp. MCL-LM]|jgi:histone H3/H4|uniref:histone family protein n=1 Tax=Methanocella sp. MCL-LM TaxID=3412035 RepID=UPI003C752BC0